MNGHADAQPVPNGNGIDVGYKGLRAQITGPMALLTAVFLLVGGTACYIGYRGFEDVKVLLKQSTADHDLLSCVVSLSPEEREQLRWIQHPSDFQRLCPWLRAR